MAWFFALLITVAPAAPAPPEPDGPPLQRPEALRSPQEPAAPRISPVVPPQPEPEPLPEPEPEPLPEPDPDPDSNVSAPLAPPLPLVEAPAELQPAPDDGIAAKIERARPKYRRRSIGFGAGAGAAAAVSLGLQFGAVGRPNVGGELLVISTPFLAGSGALAGLAGASAGRFLATRRYKDAQAKRSEDWAIYTGAVGVAGGVAMVVTGWSIALNRCFLVIFDEPCSDREWRTAVGLHIGGSALSIVSAAALGYGVGYRSSVRRWRRRLRLEAPQVSVGPHGNLTAAIRGRF